VDCSGARTGEGALGLTALGSVMMERGWETVGEGGQTGGPGLKGGKEAGIGLEVEI